MRVVLDANILVRANEKSAGPARALLLELIAKGHTVLTSSEILIELGRVLRYPSVQAVYRLSEEQIYEYIQFLRSVCALVPDDIGRNVPVRDAADAPVLRAAILGEADFICTLDSDFYTAEITTFCEMMEITITDDVALMRRLRAQP